MLWNFSRVSSLPPVGELMRRVHSRWLTKALTDGRACPRIPVRPVLRGGFSSLTSRAEGRRWAEAWWESAFERVDAGDD